MKGEDTTYAIALVFTFILGISAVAVLYSDLLRNKTGQSELQRANDILGLPKGFLSELAAKENLKGSMDLVSAINETNLKGFIIENTGNLPLTGLRINVGGIYYEPYAAPSVLLPGYKGAIIVDENAWQVMVATQKATITTAQRVNIVVLGIGK